MEATAKVRYREKYEPHKHGKQFQCTWFPEGKPKAILFVVHGLGDHSGRFDQLARWFTDKGYLVHSLDHIGHGKTAQWKRLEKNKKPKESKYYFKHFDDLVSDLDSFVDAKLKESEEKLPVFMLGHSMGGLMLIFYLQQNQAKITAAVLSAPPVDLPDQVTSGLITAARVISRVTPHLGLEKLDISTLSHDPAVVKSYDDDPLVWHEKIAAQCGLTLVLSTQQIAQVHDIKLPFMYTQGSADTMVPEPAAEPWFTAAEAKSKKYVLFKGWYHELHNEPGDQRTQYYEVVFDYFQAQMKGADPAIEYLEFESGKLKPYDPKKSNQTE